MSELKIKLNGLTEVDTRSFKSMLSVINDQLTAKWIVVESDPADLYLYSFDTDEGMALWQQHNPQTLSALLTTDESADDSFDIIFKKPLKRKHFSLVLNDIEQKIRKPQQHPKSQQKEAKQTSFLSSLFSGHLFGGKSKTARPVLRLTLPGHVSGQDTTLLNQSELESFARTLENSEHTPETEDIAAYLFSLNRTEQSCEKHFSLLEAVMPHIRQLMTAHYPDKFKFRQESHVNFSRMIHSLNQLLTEYSSGYQRVVDDFYQQGKKIKSQPSFAQAIHRIAELGELLLSFNSRYYFSLPHHTLNILHQLYAYCAYYGVLDTAFDSVSFNHRYKRILLTGIINPYRLPLTDIQQLPILIDELAADIYITMPDQDQVITTAGSFLLDLDSDDFPKPLTKLDAKTRLSEHIRLFDTHTLLEKIEHGFAQENTDDNEALLKQIVPQLNASYTRQSERQICHDRPKIQLLLGLPAIHMSLTGQTPSESFQCTVNNKSAGGMMIESTILDSYAIEIGDVVGIIDTDQQQKLAIIRWLTSNQNGQSFIGLEFMAQATPVTLELENKSDSFIGLIVPVPIRGTLQKTILVSKGTYLPLQAMTVTEGKAKYKIVIDKLMDNTTSCEQFLYHIKD